MAQVLGNDFLPALRSPDAAARRSAEALLETQFANEPLLVIFWLLDQLMCAAHEPDRQMAAVLIGRSLPTTWDIIMPQGRKQITDVLQQVLQEERSRSILRLTASALVSLASAQASAGHTAMAQGVVVFVGGLLSSSSNEDVTREVGCIMVSDILDRLHEHIAASDLDSLQSVLTLIILTSEVSQLQLAAVKCVGCIAAHRTTPMSCIAHVVRTLISEGVDSDLKEDTLRSCFEALQEEQSPQSASLELAICELASPRQGADERTQAQAIRMLTLAAKKAPQIFGVEARRSCVQALCGLCTRSRDCEDSEFLPDAAREGISALAEALASASPRLRQEQDSTVLALCWALAASSCAGASDTDRSHALSCFAAALVGTFRAAGKYASPEVLSSTVQLPPNVASVRDVLLPLTSATADTSAVVRCTAASGLRLLVDHAAFLYDELVWTALADAIRKCLSDAMQDESVRVQDNVVRMVRAIAVEVTKERLVSLLGCIVPAIISLSQKAVPSGFETTATCETDWTAVEDRLDVVAVIAEVAGPGFSPHAVQTTTGLLQPLLHASTVPLAAKLVALRALGPVLASAGPPTPNGPWAMLLPFWKDGLQTAEEALRSDVARTQSLGFYAALATVFHGGMNSVVPAQTAMEMVPLDLVVPAALSALNAPGATGEAGPDCAKTWCVGAAATILQGGPRTWVRTQAHEEARHALFALQTVAVSNGQLFLKAMPEVLSAMAPRFATAASPPIRLASLGLLAEMWKVVSTAKMSCQSCHESEILDNLSGGLLRSVAAAISAEPRSTTVCHEGDRVLAVLRETSGKDTSLIDGIVKGLGADKHVHEDDDDSDANDVVLINGHRIAKAGGC